MPRDNVIEPVESGARGIATDACIDDNMVAVHLRQSLAQQIHPSFIRVDPICCADTISKHNNYGFIFLRNGRK